MAVLRPCTVGNELQREDAADAGEAAGCLGREAEDQRGALARRWHWLSCLLTAALAPGAVPVKWHVGRLGEHKAISGNVAFWDWAIQHWAAWIGIFAFVSAQLGCFAATGDSLFGILTGGIVESLRLTTGVPMTWHMCTGSAMWGLAFVQIFFKRLRKGPLAWIHRASGRLFLLLWFLVVGPTAFYLSLNVGVGRARAHVFMGMFAITGMDTTVLSCYYFWRALVVARYRTNGQDSFDLHGRSMRMGTKLTMLILAQRPMQFIVISIRRALLTAWDAVPWEAVWGTGPGWTPSALRTAVGLLSDHNVILSYTTILPAALLLVMLDGPRSHMGRWALALKEHEAEPLFGSSEPSLAEVLAWRLRAPLYILLRVVAVQRGWVEGLAAAAAAGE